MIHKLIIIILLIFLTIPQRTLCLTSHHALRPMSAIVSPTADGPFSFQGKREIIDELSKHFKDEIDKDDNRHIFYILSGAKETLKNKSENVELAGKCIESLDKLLKDIYTGEGPFDRNNLAYQALKETIRAWPKRDLHCHVTASIPTKWIVDRLKQRPHDSKLLKWLKYHKQTMEEEAEKQNRDLANDMAYQLAAFLLDLNQEDWNNLTEVELDREFFGNHKKYKRDQSAARGLIIDSLDEYKKALRAVIRRYFNDGVKEPEIRFNPLSGKFGKEKLDEILSVIYDVAFHEELDAMREVRESMELDDDFPDSVPVYRVSFLLSFDRERDTPEKAMECLEYYLSLRQRGLAYERVVGIDLAGKEQENTDTSKWKDVIELARKKGLVVASHAGDLNNTSLTPEGQVEYLADTVETEGVQRIGHNTAASKYLISGPRRGEGLDEETWRKAQKVLREERIRHITIEALPYREILEDGYNLKKHPFYDWYKRGIKTVLGVDGLFYGPDSLSEWILMLLLAAPYKDIPEEEVLTVRAVRDMVTPNTYGSLNALCKSIDDEIREFVREAIILEECPDKWQWWKDEIIESIKNIKTCTWAELESLRENVNRFGTIPKDELEDQIWQWYWRQYSRILSSYFDLTANTLSTQEPQWEKMETLKKHFGKIATKNQTVLDVGTGRGHLALLIAKENLCNVIGIDISYRSIGVARERAESASLNNVEFKEEDIVPDIIQRRSKEFDDESFDVVVSCSTLYLLPSRLRIWALEEIYRVLKPNGRIQFLEETCLSDLSDYEKGLAWREERWKIELRQIGFENVKTISALTGMFLISAEKPSTLSLHNESPSQTVQDKAPKDSRSTAAYPQMSDASKLHRLCRHIDTCS